MQSQLAGQTLAAWSVRGGWLRTGDLGITDEYDMIKLLDRRIT